MKKLILFFTIVLTVVNSHSQNIEGTYSNKWVSNSGEGKEFVLRLNEDGNFTFNYIRMYRDSDSNTKIEVQGSWVLDGHLLVLNSNNSNEEDNHIASGLNLNKARFISVSPRNPNSNMVKSSLKFFESDVFYAEDMELIKTSSTVSAVD
jgi:hypothetical protein